MTVKKLQSMLDSVEQQIDLIAIAVQASEVRPGYNESYKKSSLRWLHEAQDKIRLSIGELDRLAR